MPSPIGHALGGLLVGLLLAPAAPPRSQAASLRSTRGTTKFLGVCMFAACLPDLDFAWGRHNMETHSLTFAALTGALAFAWWRWPRLAIACLFAGLTHVLFDWLGSDDFPPLGVMALWPFSTTFYFADAYVFATISRRYWLPGFLAHNMLSVLRELAILVPIATLAAYSRTRHDRAGRRGTGQK